MLDIDEAYEEMVWAVRQHFHAIFCNPQDAIFKAQKPDGVIANGAKRSE